MSETKQGILIVDDKWRVLTTMSSVLMDIGYHVRTAADSYSALRAIREENPDILLSDLHMPGMSGFELLRVVRRRFPAILVVAMSGAYAGKEVPSAVAADGYFQKGGSMSALLQLLPDLQTIRLTRRLSDGASPVPVRRFDSASAIDGQFTIACPDCRKAATETLRGVGNILCAYCGNTILYAIVERSAGPAPPQNRNVDQAQNTLTFDG